MKVLLVNPTKERLFEQPSLGLLYIAGSLKKAGHEVHYIEGTGESLWLQLMGYLYLHNLDVIGFTVMSPMFNEVQHLVQDIHHECWSGYGMPRPLIIAGGAHATLMPKTLLEAGVDHVIQGEGEKTTVDLLEDISVGIKRNSIVEAEPILDLDSLEFPARELLPEKYRKRHAASIMASRGCPYNCSFCQPTLRKLFGAKVRKRAPENVALEMKHAWSQGFRYFEFFDDTFTADKLWLHEFCEILKVQGIPWRWECLTRVNAVDEPSLEEMKEAGCHRITFGVESGSQEILDFYRKGITLDQIREAFRLCHELGIHSHALFMLGAPVESHETIAATEQLIREIKPDSIFISITTPLPYTDLWEDCIQRGWAVLDWSQINYYHKPALPLQHLTPDEVVAARERILKDFYLHHPLFVLKLLKARGWSYTLTAVRNLF